MTVEFAKRIAAEILGRGESAVRINPSALSDVSKAMTREDVKRFVKDGSIYAIKAKHNISLNSKLLKIKRRKGRSRGPGRRKGSKKARSGMSWKKKVRSQRTLLSKLKEMGKLDRGTYRHFYRLIKGNSFPDKASLLLHMSEQGIKVDESEMKQISEYMKKRYE